MHSRKTLVDKYKDWISKTFPGKTPKQLEDWDFIMVFEERYRDEMEAYFVKYMNSVSKGTQFKVIDHEKDEEILVLIKISQEEVYNQAESLKILKRKKKKSFGFDLKTINREIYLAE